MKWHIDVVVGPLNNLKNLTDPVLYVNIYLNAVTCNFYIKDDNLENILFV